MSITRPACLCLLALFLGTAVAGPEDKEDQNESKVAVLGASNGEIELHANAAAFSTSLTIESLADQGVDVLARVTPFRDSKGRMHAAWFGGSANARSAEQSLKLSAHSSAPVEVAAELGPEGEYSGELILVVGKTRSAVKISVTRALDEMGVEVLGIEPVNDLAARIGETSTTLRMTLGEKAGRSVMFATPVLIEYARKEGDSRDKTGFKIQGLEPAQDSISLGAGESKELGVKLDGFEGAGEYVGKLRFISKGYTPVDAAFTVTLRESAWSAFGAILLGVIVSTILRWLTQQFRPRLMERRRLFKLVLALDSMLREPDRDPAEAEVIGVLREHCSAVSQDIDDGDMNTVKTDIDLLESRRKLFIDWVRWRRRVLALSPPELRKQFMSKIETVRTRLVEKSTAEQLTAAGETLSGLGDLIDTALDKELEKRIKAIEDSIVALVARPSSVIAVRANAEVRPLLKEAEAQRGTDLPRALATYMQARAIWAGLLLDDLAGLLAMDLPLQVDAAAKAKVTEPLIAEVKSAIAQVSGDTDGAIRQYDSVLARYVAGLCELMPAEFAKVTTAIATAKKDGAINADEMKTLNDQVTAAQLSIEGARKTNLEGNRQEALASVLAAMKAIRETIDQATRKTRGEAKVAAMTAETLQEAIGSAPGELADPQRRGLGRSFGGAPVTQATISRLARLNKAIDWLSTFVAIVVASVLGITTLWSTDATWGGWQDWLVAMLWGLGLHQFTFTSVNSLRDRITGAEAAGATT
jgi:hypothetical protein